VAVEITVRYEGNMRCRATHGPSGAELGTVPPVDNGGDGSCFSPTDLAATAFATCVVTILAQAAAARGVELGEVVARVEKHMTTAPPRRIDRLPLVVHVGADLDAGTRHQLEQTARGCPVCRSLAEAVGCSIAFRWGSSVGRAPVDAR